MVQLVGGEICMY